MQRPHLPTEFPVRRLLPSMVTLLALASGMTGIRYAFLGNFEAAVIGIMIAAVLDIVDGKIAVLFKAQSRFGAELDSLADLVSFGVAPALIMYIWSLQHAGQLGWLAALLMVLCAALRLARYNVLDSTPVETPITAYTKKSFSGVPSPAGAGMVLMPLICSIAWGFDIRDESRLLALWLVIVSLLMVARFPTLALKGWRIPAPFVLPLMLAVGLLAASLVTDPFTTVSIIGFIYMLSLPVFYIWQLRKG